MTKTKTADWKATVEQILRYEEAGCQIVRCTANDEDAANALKKIKENIHIPLVADIHFQHKLALIAVKSGVDKIRINPGNIGNKEKVAEVLRACKDNGIPIRIGVNAGSLEKDILRKVGYPTSEGMVESALKELDAKSVVTLDNERKAAMVSNLLVVLCGTSEASPVINTGTLYT